MMFQARILYALLNDSFDLFCSISYAVRPACTHLSFYEGGKKIFTGYTKYIRRLGRQYTHSMCAHPKTTSAGRACCNMTQAIEDRSDLNYKFEYYGEVVTAETNAEICEADDGFVCKPPRISTIFRRNPKYPEIDQVR